MSPALAIASVAALLLILLVPLALVAWKGASAGPVAAVYAPLLSAIAAYQSGMFSQAELPDPDIAGVATSSLADAQCAEILSLLDRARVIVDRSHPPRLAVVQDSWSQLPEVAQEAVVECVQRSWPADADTAEIEAQ